MQGDDAAVATQAQQQRLQQPGSGGVQRLNARTIDDGPRARKQPHLIEPPCHAFEPARRPAAREDERLR